MTNTILGIDLGTTYSACAIWQDGVATVIKNALGNELTPSVVGVDDDGSILVGQAARERLLSHPESTVGYFKRLMGTDHKVQIGKKHKFTATELSALVLGSVKADAEAFLGTEVTHAVISVPAYFNEHQRQATRDAGELAGLTVNRLINEPTAASMAHGLIEEQEHRFLVLDLGGGTFDVSILEYFDGVLEVHATSGDSALGGEDFNEALLRAVLKEHGLEEKIKGGSERQKLYARIETAKRNLKRGSTTSIKFDFNDQEFETKLDEEYFKSATANLLVRIRAPIERAMRDAGVSPAEIDDVVLVGGSTRLSVFRSMISKLFGRLPRTDVDPDLTVVHGAAIQAGLVAKDESLDDVVLTDVCPFSLGIATVGDDMRPSERVFSPILERNSVVPVSRVQQYFTVSDSQDRIIVSVYQGESRWISNNLFLGSLEVPVPANDAGKESISVRFSYDVNGLLEVDVQVDSTGQTHATVIENRPGSLSAKEKTLSADRLRKLKVLPHDRAEVRALTARADRIFASLLGAEREQLGLLMGEFEQVLSRQDPQEIVRRCEEYSRVLDQLDRDIWS